MYFTISDCRTSSSTTFNSTVLKVNGFVSLFASAKNAGPYTVFPLNRLRSIYPNQAPLASLLPTFAILPGNTRKVSPKGIIGFLSFLWYKVGISYLLVTSIQRYSQSPDPFQVFVSHPISVNLYKSALFVVTAGVPLVTSDDVPYTPI